MNRSHRTILSYVVLACLALSLVSMLERWDRPEDISYSQMVQLFQQEQVTEFSIRDNEVTLKLKEPLDGEEVISCSVHSFDTFYADLNDLIQQQKADGIITKYNYFPDSTTPWWAAMLPSLITALLVFFLFFTC